VASAASTDTRPASTTEPDASNRWVRIEPPGAGQDAVSLGLSVEKGPDLGFRPSRGIKSPSLPYEIEQHEVTWDELDASSTARPEAKVPAGNAGGIPSGPPGPSDREARKKYPATGIAWTTALEHCKARGGSLPTEEQWEYAARGRDLRPYPWGTEPLDLTRTVAFRGTKAELAPVTSSDQDRTVDPPETALFDLAGNALEWTLDIYRDDRAGQPEGWAQEGGLTFRAVRGLPPADPAPKSLPKIGAAYRQALCATGPCPADTANVLQWVGFRCARLAK
jgi:formylglycine-generating enzyme required for sulfatase activity